MLTMQFTRCNVLGIVTANGERFIYLFDDESSTELTQALGRHASNPDLSINWHECAVLSQAARRLKEKRKP